MSTIVEGLVDSESGSMSWTRQAAWGRGGIR